MDKVIKVGETLKGFCILVATMEISSKFHPPNMPWSIVIKLRQRG